MRNVFQFLSNSHKQFKYKHLLVSPYYMREAFEELIDRETRNARKGRRAYIYAKCNSLTDGPSSGSTGPHAKGSKCASSCGAPAV